MYLHQSMEFIRRKAYTLRKSVSLLVLFSSFVLLCMLLYISVRLQGLPIDWIPLSYSLQSWNPIIKGIAEIQGGWGRWSWTVSWTCRLTTDTSERISELYCGLELVGTVQLNISWRLCLLKLWFCWEGFSGLESFVNLKFLAFFKEEMDILALTLSCEKKN